jgi:hypothetical protein
MLYLTLEDVELFRTTDDSKIQKGGELLSTFLNVCIAARRDLW